MHKNAVWSDRPMIRIPAELLLLAITANRSKQICIFITMSGGARFLDFFFPVISPFFRLQISQPELLSNEKFHFLCIRKHIKFIIHILFTLLVFPFMICEFLSMPSQVTFFFLLWEIQDAIFSVVHIFFFSKKKRQIDDHILLFNQIEWAICNELCIVTTLHHTKEIRSDVCFINWCSFEYSYSWQSFGVFLRSKLLHVVLRFSFGWCALFSMLNLNLIAYNYNVE